MIVRHLTSVNSSRQFQLQHLPAIVRQRMIRSREAGLILVYLSVWITLEREERMMAAAEAGRSAHRKVQVLRSWFPLAWLVIVSGISLGVQASSVAQDIKNTAILICIGVFFLGWSAWALWLSPMRLGWRILVGAAPWALALALFSSVELINNGDIGIVGWQWRWAAKHDEQLAVPASASGAITDFAATSHDYPRFLGNGHWAEVADIELATDWSVDPPTEVWRRPIGAGWSGFAIVGDYAFTQEQRGQHELVVCYRVNSQLSEGEVVWSHADKVRFDQGGRGALGGIGPRATPTVYKDRVYTMGATGIVNCLDARTGEAIWSHDTLADFNITNIMWGKASSPLVVETSTHTMVVISVGAPSASLVAYDSATGDQLWSEGDSRSSYASPVLAELLGEQYILSVNEDLVTAHKVNDGKIVWQFDWPGNSDTDATVSQPVPVADDKLFLSKGYGTGAMLLQLKRTSADTIEAEPVWTRKVMKTKMGNVVVRDGYVYGLDAGILQCVDLADGRSVWKKRRTPALGHGQIMLVANAIVVMSESGELVLVEPTPEEYRELAAMRVFPPEQVTWNNPALSSPYLLLRNSEQAVCLRMPLEKLPVSTASAR